MADFSLIVTSCDRDAELERLFQSLEAQSFEGDVEVIFVNQGTGRTQSGGLRSGTVVIEHSSNGRIPLSKARNLGLSNFSGEIVAFPDDDCWYDPELLTKVAAYFRDNPAVACLCTSVFDPERKLTYGSRPLNKRRRVTYGNVFRLPSSAGIFIRRESLIKVGAYFDERLGVGTPVGCGEETELISRLLNARLRVEYVGDFQVFHPVPEYTTADAQKYRAYGIGFGYVNGLLLRAKHIRVITYLLEIIGRSVAGIAVYLFCPLHRSVYNNRLAGIFVGFMHGFTIDAQQSRKRRPAVPQED